MARAHFRSHKISRSVGGPAAGTSQGVTGAAAAAKASLQAQAASISWIDSAFGSRSAALRSSSVAAARARSSASRRADCRAPGSDLNSMVYICIGRRHGCRDGLDGWGHGHT